MVEYSKVGDSYCTKCGNFFSSCVTSCCYLPLVYIFCCPCVILSPKNDDENLCFQCDVAMHNYLKCCCHFRDKEMENVCVPEPEDMVMEFSV